MARQIASGLAAAHAAGVIHRDLKPGNIMIAADGRALLTDFGIARSTASATVHTLPGSILGTLEYLAPEQAQGQAADERTDVYALGLVFYELLAGGRPFATRAGGLADLLARLKAGAPPLQSVVPDVPPDTARIVSRCLEPDPAARYPSAAELLADLNALDPEGRQLRQAAVPTRWKLAAASAVLAAVLIASVVWGTRRTASPVATPPRAPLSVLIANFENKAKDPVFQESLEQSLGIAVEGASFITSFTAPRCVGPGAAASTGGRARRIGGSPRRDPRRDRRRARRRDRAGRQRLPDSGQGLRSRGGTSLWPWLRLERRAKPTSSPRSARSPRGFAKRWGTRVPRTFRTPRRSPPAPWKRFAATRRRRSCLTGRRIGKRSEVSGSDWHDPKFGRAYAGWAGSARALGRRSEADEKWKSAFALMDRMTEREKLRTYGGHYIAVTRNYEKAMRTTRCSSRSPPPTPPDTATSRSRISIRGTFARRWTRDAWRWRSIREA